MKKFSLLAGGAVGFLLGSYAGRAPYERSEALVHQLLGRPPVQRVASQVTESANQVGEAAAGAASKAAEAAADRTAAAVSSVSDRVTDHLGDGDQGSTATGHGAAGS